MYDAIADPYTYENSTVLVNKLDLRQQAELDARRKFRAPGPTNRYPKEISTSHITRPFIIICFKMSTSGPARSVPFASSRVATRFAFLKTSKIRQQGCLMSSRRTASCRA